MPGRIWHHLRILLALGSAGVLAWLVACQPSPSPIATADPPARTETIPSLPRPSQTETLQPLPSQTETRGATTEPAILKQCPQAPPSTLKTQDWVRVSLDPPLPNRIRSEPGSAGTILGEAAPGSDLLVLEGPACLDGFAWWQVRTVDGLEGWTIEGDPASYWLVEPISPWTSLPPALDPQANNTLQLDGLRLSVPSVFQLPGGVQQTFFPMATPLPTLAPNVHQDDPREGNHREYMQYIFEGQGAPLLRIHLVPLSPELPLNWSGYKDYAGIIQSMAGSGNILPASLRPFTGLESFGGAPVAILASSDVLEFTGGRGIRYLIGTHNATPVLNPLYYVFQGVTDDGSMFVYVFAPVRGSYLLSGQDLNESFGPFIGWNDPAGDQAVQGSYDVYNQRLMGLLEAELVPLYPALEILDAVVRSIEIQ